MTEDATSDEPKPAPDPLRRRVTLAFVMVQVGVLLSLLWKVGFFRDMDLVYQQILLEDPFFPAWLRDAAVLRWAYLSVVCAIVVSIAIAQSTIRTLACLIASVSLLVILVHQGSYNDMTFATSFWCSLWSVWFATRIERDQPALLLRKAALLARVIGSLMLLGGAVGKWTAEYWDGRVLYDIYFVDRDFWVFNRLREQFDGQSLRGIATWYSRSVVVLETCCGLGMWLLPARSAASVGVLVFFSIAFFSNVYLFSVLWCLILLSAVGWLTPKGRLVPKEQNRPGMAAGAALGDDVEND